DGPVGAWHGRPTAIDAQGVVGAGHGCTGSTASNSSSDAASDHDSKASSINAWASLRQWRYPKVLVTDECPSSRASRRRAFSEKAYGFLSRSGPSGRPG